MSLASRHLRRARPLLLTSRPCLSFLLPSFQTLPSPLNYRSTARLISSASRDSTYNYTAGETAKGVKAPPLSREKRDFLDRALRVNQAGELAATLIYTHQTPPISRAHPHLRSLMQHMYSQEAGHFSTFNHLVAEHRVRPTVMYPVWTAAASALGWATGLMGREAAMACTEAVETEIGEHYNGQVRVLIQWLREMEERGEQPGEEVKTLVETLKTIRDEELEHLDEAVGEGAKEAKPYQLLNRVIRSGCRGAIWISERI